ncbi:MAG: hypothetical protein IKF14_14225 [Atopobiaceae bacterium]|nr:hypothetical protein [Atopobiaceae bacterium]
MIPRIEQPIVLYEAEERPNHEREGQESNRREHEHARRRRPPQRIASHPRRRRRSRLRRLRRLARTPLFAYAVAAIVLSVVLFVLTIPTPHYSDLPTNGDKEQAEQPKPRPEHDEYVEPRPIAHEFEGSSADAVRATNAYGVLTRAIGEFEDTGDLISFAMLDLATGNDLRYDSGRVQYPASSIKAPYTAAVFQELVETGQASPEEVYPIAEETIVESSDDAYSDLHERYGMDVFATWLQNAGIGPGEYGSYGEMLIWHYPHINTDQLLAMWLHMYNYLQSGTEPSQTLASFLERRTVSAMRAALGPDVRTWSKMGWFDYFGDFYSEPATVEGGVVFASEGTYVVTVMTTAPAQISELEPIFTALARAHFEMI